MLVITADAFSGRQNPTWLVEDESEVRDVLRKAALHRNALASADGGELGLGFRGLVVQFADDSLARSYDLPSEFRLASGASANEAAGVEIAEQILERIPSEEAFIHGEAAREDLPGRLLDELREFPRPDPQPEVSGPLYGDHQPVALDDLAQEEEGASAAAVCAYVATAFNPGFWNNDPAVRSSNNCYNYACNRRTNTFAQPGRAVGSMYRSLDCPEVSRAARADGNHIWGICFPPGTGGLWIMALVMAPGIDYHWYRFMSNGYWTHKPGGTPATDRDNSGNLIRDPRTCNRGRYTQFCGFFQTAYTVRVR